ncbi:hypothetical protein IC582_024899 [Cucumis melo]|uniref:Uncharacterized protein LOC103497413 isoform X1 n=1 Tax=Cucumis melo TaxID=3656 RepID=A0A1S3C723_CUCME|nr:uncharacterized protein LOC103497413 isoform X1 [Cucumis melo]
MSLGGEKRLRLSRLVDHCLHPFTEEDGVVLESKGKEKELLIALSHVVTEVQRWAREIDGDSDNEAIQMKNSHEKSSDEQDQSLESHHYMTKIVSELVPLLAFENKYVKHLVANVLTAVTKFIFLTGSASDWYELVHSLCFGMELVLARIISSPAPSNAGSDNLDCYLSILLPKLKNANFSTVAGLLQVLRNTLKFLKQEQSDFIGELFDSVNSCLSKIPWDLLGRILTEKSCNIVEIQSNDDMRSNNLHRRQGLKFLFLGNFVQFLCSLAEQSDFEEASCGSFKSHPLLGTIINLIPNLFDWCLNNQVDHFDRCLSRYFSHKLLILMIRLSFHCHLQCSTLVIWLQLCRKRFQNLLLLPKLELESSSDTSLEDSPLIVSYFGDKCSPCSLHLRRLAVFLFLRCSLSFTCKQTTEKCDPSTFLATSDDCTCSKKGILELYKWLLGNLPTNIFLDTNMYAKNCTKFASSFLQLYMHEDDLLFKVLLQLLQLPSHREPCSCEGPSQEVKEDILFHVSNIFDPQHMFHIFLKELNYDHEMLLDYLVSKDAGTCCLEYLLRCLHIINDSRHALVDSSGKRRKVMLNSSTISEERLSGSPKRSKETLPSFEDTGNCDYGYKPQRVGVESLKKSKNCLHLLKTSLENLHRENLFPYNPKVLIKRLTKFLELPIGD